MSACEDPTTVPRYRLSLVREAESPYVRGDLLDRPDAVAAWLWREIYHDAAQEKMSAVFLDVRNRLIAYQVAYVGTLARAAVEPRAIMAGGPAVQRVEPDSRAQPPLRRSFAECRGSHFHSQHGGCR